MSRFSSGVVSNDFITSSSLDLTTTTATGIRFLLADDELHVGPFRDFGAAAAGSAEQGQFHGARIGRMESGGQIRCKLVGAGKADFSIADAEGGHALQKAHGIGYGNLDIRLLHSVAKTGIKQLDFSGSSFLHFCLFPMVKMFFASLFLKPFFRPSIMQTLRMLRLSPSAYVGIPSGAKARFDFARFAARLKPCPFKSLTCSQIRRGFLLCSRILLPGHSVGSRFSKSRCRKRERFRSTLAPSGSRRRSAHPLADENASLRLKHLLLRAREKCPRGLNRLAAPPLQPVEPRGLARPRRPQVQPLPPHRRRKLAGRFTLAVLLLLAVITGSLAGLTLVYSVDLPQIHDLEHYRPSTNTELYDRKGRIIGILCPGAPRSDRLRRLRSGAAPGRHLH